MTPQPLEPKAKPEPIDLKDVPLGIHILTIIILIAVPIGLIWMCSGLLTSDMPSSDSIAEVETSPPPEAPSPDPIETPTTPKKQLYEVVDSSSVPNIKYSIEYRYTGSGLPTKAELRHVSDEVERRQPGYQRYFIGFYLPQQPAGEGFFATAHRDPDVTISIMSFMVPDRMQEISDFYSE